MNPEQAQKFAEQMKKMEQVKWVHFFFPIVIFLLGICWTAQIFGFAFPAGRDFNVAMIFFGLSQLSISVTALFITGTLSWRIENGITASMLVGVLSKQTTRIEQLERQLKESNDQQEALRESLRARVGALERQLDELRAAIVEKPKP